MNKKSTLNFLRVLSWALLGLNQRPPDYESYFMSLQIINTELVMTYNKIHLRVICEFGLFTF